MLDNVITVKDICGVLHISRPTLMKRVAEGSFPRPLPTGNGKLLWPRHALEDYLGLELSGELPDAMIEQVRAAVRDEFKKLWREMANASA